MRGEEKPLRKSPWGVHVPRVHFQFVERCVRVAHAMHTSVKLIVDLGWYSSSAVARQRMPTPPGLIFKARQIHNEERITGKSTSNCTFSESSRRHRSNNHHHCAEEMSGFEIGPQGRGIFCNLRCSLVLWYMRYKMMPRMWGLSTLAVRAVVDVVCIVCQKKNITGSTAAASCVV